MFGKNHIAAAIISAAMVFSMMPLGAIAAEPAGTEVNAQEAGIADAGEYLSAGERVEYLSAGEHHSTGERTNGNAAIDTETRSDAGSGENGSGAEDAYRAAAGSDDGNSGGETGAGQDWAGADSGAGSSGAGGSGSGAGSSGSGAAGEGTGAAHGEGADGGASGGGAASSAGETGEAGSTAADMGGASGKSSEAATDQAASAAAGTEAADAVETSLISIHGIVGREFVQYGEIDSESLAGQYFDREVRGTDEEGGPESGAALKGVDKVIYDALRKAVEEIAAGLRDSGVVRIPISSGATGFKSRYTAADLGLDYVYSGSLNPDLMEALEKAAPVHYDEILDCLIADSECAMFPFTGGVERPACCTLPFYASGSGDDLDVFWDDYVEIALRPADEFADPDSGRYAIDTARIKVARGTAGAAKKIVKSASHIVNRSGFIPTTK